MEVKSLVIHENAKFDGNCKMIVQPDNVKALNPEKKWKKKQIKPGAILVLMFLVIEMSVKFGQTHGSTPTFRPMIHILKFFC